MVRERRQALGLSQEVLARRAGLTQSEISKVELGQLKPTTETRKKIARALRTNVRAVFPQTCAVCGGGLEPSQDVHEAVCLSCASPLRHARRTRSLGQAALAQLVGISKTHLCNLELGVRAPSPELAEAIARELGFSTRECFGDPMQCACGCGGTSWSEFRPGHEVRQKPKWREKCSEKFDHHRRSAGVLTTSE